MVEKDVIAAGNGPGKEPNPRGVENRAWMLGGSRKMKVDIIQVTDISTGASQHERRSPSNNVLDLATERDLHTCIGSIETSMQLIMDHL
jgi:hypothetical protein